MEFKNLNLKENRVNTYTISTVVEIEDGEFKELDTLDTHEEKQERVQDFEYFDKKYGSFLDKEDEDDDVSKRILPRKSS